jgi:hypothetical protein
MSYGNAACGAVLHAEMDLRYIFRTADINYFTGIPGIYIWGECLEVTEYMFASGGVILLLCPLLS